jgi:ATP-dependent exoDNAse (exonuclease V) alpha subunit
MKLINEWVRERKNCVRLTTTNKIADYINKQKMEELPDMEYLSILKTTIFHQTETVRSPMKDELFIKEGMKMMFVMNDSQINGRRWVNGTIGRVVRKSFNEDKKLISVAVKVINRVSMDDKVYEVTRESYDIYEPFYNQDTDTIESRCIAKVEQFPFIPAWAITIHKSQSLTLDEIGIELGARAFAEGQVYVALSRVRARYGFFLNRPIVREDIKVSPETIRFYQESILPSKIDVFDPDAERADEALAQEIYEEIYLPGSIVNDFKF